MAMIALNVNDIAVFRLLILLIGTLVGILCLNFPLGKLFLGGRGSLYFWACFSLDSAPSDEPASGNFAAGPPVDFSLANYRYVAVDDAAQKIRKAHWATRPDYIFTRWLCDLLEVQFFHPL